MSDELGEAVRALVMRLVEQIGPRLASDPALRAAALQAARAATEWLEHLTPSPTITDRSEAVESSHPINTSAHPPPLVIPPDFTLARPPLATPRSHVVREEEERGIVPTDLDLLSRRCRLKAEAVRYAAARRRGEIPKSSPEDLIRQAATLPDCDLWMLNAGDYTESLKSWDDLAGAYTAGAEAAEVLATLKELPSALADLHRERVLYAAAEAQAIMWSALSEVRRRVDNDQVHLFVHVREYARQAQVYISRFLKRDDRVSADSWPGLLTRIEALKQQLSEVRGKVRTREKGFTNLKYKLRKMAESPEAAGGEWPRALELLEDVIAAGLPASNTEIRELLLPVLDTLPDDLEPGPHAERVFRSVNEYLASRPEPAETAAEEPSAEVQEVAELLRGREIVLIGGVQRTAAGRAIERAFGLSGLNWIATRPHESVAAFEPAVARPAVGVVLLAIRWASHSYGDVKSFCEKYGKPLVYLTGGYNPNQIAHQILQQVGDRLRGLTRAG